MEEGVLPHNRSIESGDREEMDEERRLAYVGITRAKRRLYLVHAFRRSLWGTTEVQQPSRFLDEIPEELLTGMVDKRSRREAAFTRATRWDNESDDWDRRSNGSGAGRAESRNPYNWSQQGSAQSKQPVKPVGWSQGSGSSSVAKPRGATTGTAGSSKPAQFKRRDSVQHPTFGVGTVIESVVTRSDEEVTIAFPGVGIKKLLVSLANLKKL
jgi:DNA helicase-2/ATP-dependent DNA helicase PcrA